jgi:hypothetical protein
MNSILIAIVVILIWAIFVYGMWKMPQAIANRISRNFMLKRIANPKTCEQWCEEWKAMGDYQKQEQKDYFEELGITENMKFLWE